MSSAHEIVFKDVSVPAPNKSALKTKVNSSKKRNKGWQWLDLIWKRSWRSGVKCWHLQMVKLSPCETALTFAAQSPPGTEMFPAISFLMPNMISLRLECFWLFFFEPEPRDLNNRQLIQHKLIKRLWTSLAASSKKRSVTQEAGFPSFRRASLSTTSRSYSLNVSLCNDSLEIGSTKNHEQP